MSSVVVHVGSSSCIDSLNSEMICTRLILIKHCTMVSSRTMILQITAFTVQFGPDCLANRIDWEEDGDVLINNNTHIKQLRIHVFGNQTVF